MSCGLFLMVRLKIGTYQSINQVHIYVMPIKAEGKELWKKNYVRRGVGRKGTIKKIEFSNEEEIRKQNKKVN